MFYQIIEIRKEKHYEGDRSEYEDDSQNGT
jgi:hypothetical protein